jgi:hypothetical protein
MEEGQNELCSLLASFAVKPNKYSCLLGFVKPLPNLQASGWVRLFLKSPESLLSLLNYGKGLEQEEK